MLVIFASTMRTSSLFVVCDGVCGLEAGEVAWISITAKLEASGDPADLDVLQMAMESDLANASREIYRQAQRNPEQQGMGTG